MLRQPNALQWDGAEGHYEVYYLTLTDPSTGIGIWIRYTMVAPRRAAAESPSAALWFLAMDPGGGVFGRKASYPVQELRARADPFTLQIDGATLTDGAMDGSLEDASWNLRWSPGRSYEHVHPALRVIASTILVLPHADVEIDGIVSFAGRTLALDAARGGQAHLWGSKHASSWAWVHCNDFRTLDGEPATGEFVDGVSVFVPRLGREIGPNTPVVGRINGQDFRSTSPLRVLRNHSTFALTGWRFEAVDGKRKLIGEVDAYCYNTETASMRLEVFERARQVGGWAHRQTLVADGRAHFEYAQRTPVPELELLTT